MRMTIRVCCGVVVCVLTLGAPQGLRADGQAQKPVPICATLLTSDEVTKALGATLKDMGARIQATGESMCPWMLQGGAGGFKTVSVQFYEAAAIKAGQVSPALTTVDAFYESVVAAAEGMASGNKREPLTGIGVKAAFIATTPQVGVVVQRTDGVARIVGNNLTKDQITAVARAVAAP
jgi:hypothetical protein